MEGSMDDEDGRQCVLWSGVVWCGVVWCGVVGWGGVGCGVGRTESLGASIPSFKE